MSQTPSSSLVPGRKVSVGALAGALAVIAFWLLSAYGHVTPPPEVVAAVTAVVTIGLAYLIPESQQA